MTLYPVILAGGSGTRLWPLSREQHPKQFLPLLAEFSMFQETLRRLDGMEGAAAPVVVCNEAHRHLVMDQMRQLGNRPLAVIVEPVGRNTAPALTLAALRLAEIEQKPTGDPMMLVMPADHVMRGTKAFQQAVGAGATLANSGYMVTFGVVPSTPATGYGYIRKGEALEVESKSRPARVASVSVIGHQVSEFVEKPEQDAARAYVETGEYLWNSGIFMMGASVWLSELGHFAPDIAKACRAAYSSGHLDGNFYRPGAAEFIACASDSIDYAVMENAAGAASTAPDGLPEAGAASSARSGCAVVPLDAGWSDIGAWSALWEEQDQDELGNVVQGDVYAQSTENALLLAQHRLLATVGMKDVVVVETADVVLVAHKDFVQDVKEVVQRLKADGRSEHEVHRKVHRPWGSYTVIDSGQGFQVKRLSVNAGSALSLQMHRHRAEHWVVVSGTAKVTKGDEVFLLTENQSTYVPQGITHRLENPGDLPLEIVEIESGKYLGEDDIVRFQDDYGRH
jgi:mannose-1-phosphate guanylyltransferase/mannose-6-phosphate isomerase-like protein (cupin superfamily)